MKNQLHQSARHLLRPFVRLALRHGLSHAEFSQLLKGVYVEVARDDFTPVDKKPSDARVAVVTGLSRKEVKAQREQLESNAPPPPRTANRATRVLSGWYQDPEFSDTNGDPLLLPMHGEVSFATLVHRYSGDIPVGTLLDELLRVGAIAHEADGHLLKLKSRNYIPASSDPEGLRVLGNAAHDLLATLDHNLNPNRESPSRLQRTVFSASLSPQATGVFRRIARDHMQQLIDILDEWLTAHETPGVSKFATDKTDGEKSGTETDSGANNVRSGVGLYYFEGPNSVAEHNAKPENAQSDANGADIST